MDSATILGLAGGILVVLQAAGGAAGLYQGTALLVVVAGGLAALLIAAPLRDSQSILVLATLLCAAPKPVERRAARVRCAPSICCQVTLVYQ